MDVKHGMTIYRLSVGRYLLLLFKKEIINDTLMDRILCADIFASSA